MMRFEYWDGELFVKDHKEEDKEIDIFNYCETMAGHTLMIDADFELVPSEMPNIYLIKKREVKDASNL